MFRTKSLGLEDKLDKRKCFQELAAFVKMTKVSWHLTASSTPFVHMCVVPK